MSIVLHGQRCGRIIMSGKLKVEGNLLGGSGPRGPRTWIEVVRMGPHGLKAIK